MKYIKNLTKKYSKLSEIAFLSVFIIALGVIPLFVSAQTTPVILQQDDSSEQNPGQLVDNHSQGVGIFLGSGYDISGGDLTFQTSIRHFDSSGSERFGLYSVDSSDISQDSNGNYYIQDIDSVPSATLLDSFSQTSSQFTSLGDYKFEITFQNINVSPSDILILGMGAGSIWSQSNRPVEGSTSTPASGIGEFDNLFNANTGTAFEFYPYLVVGDIPTINNFQISEPSDSTISFDFNDYELNFDISDVGSGATVRPLYELNDTTANFQYQPQLGDTAFYSGGSSAFLQDEKNFDLEVGHSYSLDATLYWYTGSGDTADLDNYIEMATDSHGFVISPTTATNTVATYYPADVSLNGSDFLNWEVQYQAEDSGTIQIFHSTSTSVYSISPTQTSVDSIHVNAGSGGIATIPKTHSLSEKTTWHWTAILYDSTNTEVDRATSTFTNLGSGIASQQQPPSYFTVKSLLDDVFPFDYIYSLNTFFDDVDFSEEKPIEFEFSNNPLFGTTTITVLDKSTFVANLGGQEAYDTLRDFVGYALYILFSVVLLSMIYKLIIYITTSDQ